MNIDDNQNQPMNSAGEENPFFEPLAHRVQSIYGAAHTPRGRRRLFEAMEARQRKLTLGSFTDYAAYIRREPSEWDNLWPLAFDGEGGFFRPPLQFEVAGDLLSEWSVMAPDRVLRILSLGCGRGYEIYSLAMMVDETGLPDKNWQVEIYGLDLSAEAIRQAQSGIFSEADMEWLTPVQQKKWFSPRGGGWSFKLNNLTSKLHLAAGNVYEPESWPWADLLGSFDLIFCRGLFSEAPPKVPRLLARIACQALAPTGFIFTAPGEFLPDDSDELALEERDGVTYYRRGVRRVKIKKYFTKKEKAEQRQASPSRLAMPELPPLGFRERGLLQEAAEKIESGQPEIALDLLNEVMTAVLAAGRPAPEAWLLLAEAERRLGRADSAKAAETAAGYWLTPQEAV